jgi:hypothetical protein
MAEIKPLQILTREVKDKDSLLLETIKTDIAQGIEAAIAAEIQYQFIYDINTKLTTAGAGPLQQQRLINAIIDKLTDLGYKAFMTSVPTPMLEVDWTISTLQ